MDFGKHATATCTTLPGNRTSTHHPAHPSFSLGHHPSCSRAKVGKVPATAKCQWHHFAVVLLQTQPRNGGRHVRQLHTHLADLCDAHPRTTTCYMAVNETWARQLRGRAQEGYTEKRNALYVCRVVDGDRTPSEGARRACRPAITKHEVRKINFISPVTSEYQIPKMFWMEGNSFHYSILYIALHNCGSQ